MANLYASLEDLGVYLGAEPPADSQRLLSRAMDEVDDALTAAAYAHDADGNPTDSAVIAALKKATCQQVEYWIATGDDLGQLQEYSAFSIEGISVTRASSGPPGEICERAKATLRGAGLIPGSVITS